ncbi:conjugal transfer protein TraD [Nitrospirillum bahiense]|uniref:Conjugative transfer protein TraD n=1 Tax=Nitrospirillum amazonense TaxID=28077 RepID=A0A560FHP0_9PROT|nr:conjugal transfer protein TraD [Nitrospirillum amazonense]TWB21117.1 conjugative transfer protein TraD [Nitrospirillum amazonense]
MARLTLAERLEKAAAKKAKAEQELARLKAQRRKEDDRRLKELGALVVKAGLGDLPQEALYAAFQKIAQEAKIGDRIAP